MAGSLARSNEQSELLSLSVGNSKGAFSGDESHKAAKDLTSQVRTDSLSFIPLASNEASVLQQSPLSMNSPIHFRPLMPAMDRLSTSVNHAIDHNESTSSNKFFPLHPVREDADDVIKDSQYSETSNHPASQSLDAMSKRLHSSSSYVELLNRVKSLPYKHLQAQQTLIDSFHSSNESYAELTSNSLPDHSESSRETLNKQDFDSKKNGNTQWKQHESDTELVPGSHEPILTDLNQSAVSSIHLGPPLSQSYAQLYSNASLKLDESARSVIPNITKAYDVYQPPDTATLKLSPILCDATSKANVDEIIDIVNSNERQENVILYPPSMAMSSLSIEDELIIPNDFSSSSDEAAIRSLEQQQDLLITKSFAKMTEQLKRLKESISSESKDTESSDIQENERSMIIKKDKNVLLPYNQSADMSKYLAAFMQNNFPDVSYTSSSRKGTSDSSHYSMMSMSHDSYLPLPSDMNSSGRSQQTLGKEKQALPTAGIVGSVSNVLDSTHTNVDNNVIVTSLVLQNIETSSISTTSNTKQQELYTDTISIATKANDLCTTSWHESAQSLSKDSKSKLIISSDSDVISSDRTIPELAQLGLTSTSPPSFTDFPENEKQSYVIKEDNPNSEPHMNPSFEGAEDTAALIEQVLAQSKDGIKSSDESSHLFTVGQLVLPSTSLAAKGVNVTGSEGDVSTFPAFEICLLFHLCSILIL